jgi:anti-sigma factor RsiW
MNGNDESVTQMDIELTGYLDGELTGEERRALEARLAADASLRARRDLLAGARPSPEAFDLLLADAPEDRLNAILDSTRPARPAVAWQRRRFAAIAAALLLIVIGGAIGFGVSHLIKPGNVEIAEPANWRAVVAEYLALYTDDTLAAIPDDPALRTTELANVGAKLSLHLTPEDVALPGMTLKIAQLLEFRGMPLAQIAYRSESDGPAAFCIIANGKPDRPVTLEQRDGWNIAFWNADGLGYMVIGRGAPETVETLATTLRTRDL